MIICIPVSVAWNVTSKAPKKVISNFYDYEQIFIELYYSQLVFVKSHPLVYQASSENEKLKAELDKLNKQLEDERQKVEDLMFRSEEENINKEDYNVSKVYYVYYGFPSYL